MLGKMYKHKHYQDDDFIVVEDLSNTVALLNARTNSMFWVTKHILGLEYNLKEATKPEGKPNE